MAMIPMKTLTLPNGKTYEIIDANARATNVTQQQTLESQETRLDTCERAVASNTAAIVSQKEDIQRSCATAIIKTVEGSPIVVEDSSDTQLLGLRVFGKTTQITTTGAQMFDKSTVVPGQLEADGSVAESDKYVTSDFIPVEPNTVYYHTSKGSDRGKFYDADKQPLTDAFDVQTSKAGYFATTDDVHYFRTTVVVNALNSFMMNVGQFGLPYEPYTGTIPAPNPDYPQDLKTVGSDVGSIGMRVDSMNLIDARDFDVYSNKSLEVSDDGYMITAVGGSENPYTSSVLSLNHLLDTLRGKTVFFARDNIASTILRTGNIVTLDMKGPIVTQSLIIDTATDDTVTVPNDTEDLSISIFTNNTSELLTEDNTVVIEGLRLSLVESEWVKYSNTSISILTPDGLPGIDNGGQPICDEIDLERGVYIQRVQKAIFDGSEDWSKSIDGDDNYMYHTQISPDAMIGYGQCYCDRLNRKATSAIQVAGQSVDAMGISPSPKYNVIYINVCPYMTENSVEALTKFLNENPLTVIYGLKTPIETPLSDEQIAAYKQLRSVYPVSVSLNDSNAVMQVSYNADTKTYLDRLPKVSDEQVQAAVNAWMEANLVAAEGVSF